MCTLTPETFADIADDALAGRIIAGLDGPCLDGRAGPRRHGARSSSVAAASSDCGWTSTTPPTPRSASASRPCWSSSSPTTSTRRRSLDLDLEPDDVDELAARPGAGRGRERRSDGARGPRRLLPGHPPRARLHGRGLRGLRQGRLLPAAHGGHADLGGHGPRSSPDSSSRPTRSAGRWSARCRTRSAFRATRWRRPARRCAAAWRTRSTNSWRRFSRRAEAPVRSLRCRADSRFRRTYRRLARFSRFAAKLGLTGVETEVAFRDQDLVGKFPERLALPPGLATFDALLPSADGHVYLFSGDTYWRYSAATYALEDATPQLLSTLSTAFAPLAGVDAAFVGLHRGGVADRAGPDRAPSRVPPGSRELSMGRDASGPGAGSATTSPTPPASTRPSATGTGRPTCSPATSTSATPRTTSPTWTRGSRGRSRRTGRPRG